MKELVLFFFLLLPMMSSSATSETLKLVTGPDYHPLVNEKDPDGGIATKVLRKALATEGYEIKVTFLPWVRGMENTRTGQFDATYPYVKTPDREKNFLFSDIFYVSRSKVFVTKGRFQSVRELQGKSICVPLGYEDMRAKDFIKTHQLKKVQPVSLTSCFEMLYLRRVDSVGVAEEVGWATILQQFETKNDFTALASTMGNVQYHLMVSKTNPRAKEILRVLNKSIKKLKTN
ncbi:MAG: substrate-binding periplasmic protein [Pseudobdellovibrionaceae bacterium]